MQPFLSKSVFEEAPFEPHELIESFVEYDESCNGGLGLSESHDAGVLAWTETRFLENYVRLYEVSGDVSWLDKIVIHAENVLSSSRSYHGDGETWVSDRYQVGVVRCEPWENLGTAKLSPIAGRRWVHGPANEAEYYLEVMPLGRYEICLWPSRESIAQGPLRSGRPINDLAPFSLVVTGRYRIGDRFRIKTRAPQPVDHLCFHGQLLYPLGLFCEAVSKSRKLMTSYSTLVQKIRELSSELVERHERDWLDTGRSAGAYREPPCDDVPYPNRIMAHNKYLTAARAWLAFSSVSRKRLFAERAEAMARHFRRALFRTGDAYTWAYWGKVFSTIPEDTDHSQIDIGFAVEACRRGVVFRRSDMRRFAQTLLGQMWNGSTEEPRIGAKVDRSDGDAVRFGGWSDLGEWEPRTYDVLWALFERENRPAAHAPAMLRGWLRRAQARKPLR